MIASTQSRPEFLQRITAVHSRSRRTRLMAMAAGTVCACLAAIGGLAVCDFLFELPWSVRAVALGLAMLGVAAGVISAWFGEQTRRSATRTAADLEQAFPDLGQRARTTVQFGGRAADEMRREGVRPELVDALVQETAAKSAELPLDEIVPHRRLWGASGLLLVTVLALTVGSVSWEWRRAMSRTLLSDVPYTELNVTPGNVTVQTGAAVGISVTLVGRTDRDVIFQSREDDPASATVWTMQPMLADAATDEPAQIATFGAGLDGIERTQVYRIKAGSLVSPEYRIDVLDPLTIRRVAAEVKYPSYTALPVRTIADGAISALRGSTCRFTVELSRVPEEVGVSLQELPTKSNPARPCEDVSFDGRLVTFSLPVQQNLLWTLRAKTADGVPLEEQPFRLRVTEDRPPKLSFDDPDDGIEVHTLAELPMRARASDDYGLSRSGIIFQISGSEEFTLLEEHFDDVLDAVQEAEMSESILPRTRSVLERLLPLEHFALTQKDSLMYYAFAEDNHPQEPQRAESDRRFIDIRPLLQTFRRVDTEGGGGGGFGGRLTSLGELIRRERAILNWTIKLSKRGETGSHRDVLSFDRLMRSQAEVADLTRLFAERLIERGIDDVDALYQAEAVMLEAIDSLSVGDLETAVLQEKDAQQHLVEARNRVEILISTRPNESINYQALRDLDAMILQRLRRQPGRNNDSQEIAQLLVSRLMRLARSEEDVAEQLARASASLPTGRLPSGTAGPNSPSRSGTGVDNAGGQDEDSRPDAGDEPSDTRVTADESEPANEESGNGDNLAEPAEEDATDSEQPNEPVSLETIEEQQFEILADARELAELMSDLEPITELARERMSAAAEALEAVAEAIQQRDTLTAQSGARRSARDLRELARQIVGLTQGDVMERIAFSRSLTTDLTRRQRRIFDRLETDPQAPDPSLSVDAIVLSAREIAERALTLEDILQAISRSTEPEDGAAADRVTEVMEERDVAGLRQRLKTVANNIEQSLQASGGSSPEDDEVPESVAVQTAAELRDTADTTERLAADLDRIYRQLLTPVIERLRDLEQQAAELADRMDEVDNERQGGALVDELEELIDEMEQADVGGAAREQLEELLLGRGRGELWDRSSAGTGDTLRLRAEYRAALSVLLQELQQELQELVLADTDLDLDTPVPAKYEPFIDRYLKVLSRGD